jgi:hypothetical protein
MVGRFYVKPGGDITGALSGIGEALGGIQQQREQRAEKEAKELVQDELAAAMQSGDVMKIIEVTRRHPELQKQGLDAFNITNEVSGEAGIAAYNRAISDPENAVLHLERGAQDVQASGGSPDMMMRDIEMLKQNPEAGMQNIRTGYAVATGDPSPFQQGTGSLTGYSFDPNTGTFVKQVDVPDEQGFSTLSPEQLKNQGFPSGTIVQESPTGEFKIKFKPSTGAGRGNRQAEIDNIIPQLEESGLTPEKAATEAANIVDGNISIEGDDLGNVRLFNEITKEVKEIKIAPAGEDGAERPPVAKEESLFEATYKGTGLWSAALATGSWVSSIFGGPIAEDVIEDRQTLTSSVSGFIKAFALNPRFTASEQKRLAEEINITPSIFSTPKIMQTRMKSIDKILTRRKKQSLRDSNDPSLPADTRGAQRSNAAHIQNFRDTLQIKYDLTADDLKSVEDVMEASIENLEGLGQEDLQLLPKHIIYAIFEKLNPSPEEGVLDAP